MYLVYRDCLILHPYSYDRDGMSFGLTCIILYGVSSTGKNVIFGFGLARETDRKSCEFVLKQFLAFVERKPVLVMMKRLSQTNCFFLALKKTIKDDTIAFCVYSLFEELKEKFGFLKREDQVLYKLLIGLPFV